MTWAPTRAQARNLDDPRAIVRVLTARGVRVQFVKEQLTFTGDDSPMVNLLLSVMPAWRASGMSRRISPGNLRGGRFRCPESWPRSWSARFC